MDKTGPEMDLELDFLLIPSEEELRDTSGDDLYLCSLAPLYDSGIALVNECHDNVQQWGDLKIKEVKDPEDAITDRYVPEEVILTMVAWLGSTAGISMFYKLLKTWASLRKGRKIAIKLPGGIHIETTQLSPEQFRELLEQLSKFGMRVDPPRSKGSKRRTLVPSEQEKAFKTFLKSFSKHGAEIIDAQSMEKLEKALRYAFGEAMAVIRYGPDQAERLAHSQKKHEAMKALPPKKRYLSDLVQKSEWADESGDGRTAQPEN